MKQLREPSDSRTDSPRDKFPHGPPSAEFHNPHLPDGGSIPMEEGGKHQQSHQHMQFPTHSHLPENVRTQVMQLMNQTLADATILQSHVRFAHWNVKGMAFYGLHDLFDEIAELLGNHIDEIAERVTALGGQARGTAGMAVNNCRIPQMPDTLVTGQEYVSVLVERLATHNAYLDQAIETVTELNDLDTADLLNEISREISKSLWFLEAHLQTQPIAGGREMPQPQTPQQQQFTPEDSNSAQMSVTPKQSIQQQSSQPYEQSSQERTSESQTHIPASGGY